MFTHFMDIYILTVDKYTPGLSLNTAVKQTVNNTVLILSAHCTFLNSSLSFVKLFMLRNTSPPSPRIYTDVYKPDGTSGGVRGSGRAISSRGPGSGRASPPRCLGLGPCHFGSGSGVGSPGERFKEMCWKERVRGRVRQRTEPCTNRRYSDPTGREIQRNCVGRNLCLDEFDNARNMHKTQP